VEASLWGFGKALVIAAAACAGGCGSRDSAPPAQTVNEARAPGSTSSYVPSAVTSASSAVPQAPSAHAVQIDPKWVLGDAGLTSLLRFEPVCSADESFEWGKRRSHGYIARYPSIPEADVTQMFAKAAQSLGYTARKMPFSSVGFEDVGFEDASKKLGASAAHGTVFVSVELSDSPQPGAVRLAADLGFETSTLIDSLHGNDGHFEVRISRVATGTTELNAEIPASSDDRTVIDAWAKPHRLDRDPEGWIRKYDRNAPSPFSIFIEMTGKESFSIMETRGSDGTSAACASAAGSPATSSAPAPSDRKLDPKDLSKQQDELFREMMDDRK
jgi:hypothetical protein